jgi:hypothetical protein
MSEQRRGSRADVHRLETKKLPVTRGSDRVPRKEAVSGEFDTDAVAPMAPLAPPAPAPGVSHSHAAGSPQDTLVPPPKPTLSISAAVALGDIPILIAEPPGLDDDVELLRLVTAIDGEATVAVLADRARLDAQQARAWFADLAHQGFVTFERLERAESDVESVRGAPVEAKPPEYWLQGLKPRTGK